jgi:uncharacterized delta-60 repeat protein
MRTKSIVFSALVVVVSVGACVPAFEDLDPCPAGEVRGEGDQCQPASAGGSGGSGGQGGSGGPSGAGGMTPAGAPVLQVPPRRVGLRRARAIDVTIGLQQPVGVDLSVTVDGLPAYMEAEPLTLPAGATSGVLVMRATNEAPLGVPSQVRVRAAGGVQPAEAVLEAWVQGEPGTLDETFGEGGTVEGAVTTDLVGIAPLPDGSLMLVGTSDDHKVAFTHYFADGKWDEQFGDKSSSAAYGVIKYAPPPTNAVDLRSDEEEGRGAVTQSDGKTVVFGVRRMLEQTSTGGPISIKGYRWHVSRHLPNASLDVSFGEGGAVTLGDDVPEPVPPKAIESGAPLGGVDIAPDGSIVIAARNSYDPNDASYRVIRLTHDGRLDASFGDQGVVRPSPWTCSPTSVDAVVDGSVLVGGYKKDGQGRDSICSVRLLPNGEPDPTFGNGGSVSLSVLQEPDVLYERAYGALSNGVGVFLGGFTRKQGSSDTPLIANLTFSGSYDTNFGTNGRGTDFPPSIAFGLAVRVAAMILSVEGDGIIAAQQDFTDGLFGGADALRLSVSKYDLQGRLDAGFGTEGGTNVPFGTPTDATGLGSVRLVQAPDGRIVVAGIKDKKQRIARLWP